MNKVAIIMYHYIKDPASNIFKNLKSLSLNDFKSQIDYLSERFNFISYETLADAAMGQGLLPETGALLTFDDGYSDHYHNVFPLLKQKGIPAFFSMPGKIIAKKKMLDVNKIHLILALSDVNEIINRLYGRLDYYRGREFSFPQNNELYQKLAQPGRYDTAEVIFIKRLLQAELPEKLRNIITDDLLRGCGIVEEQLVESFYLSPKQVKEMHLAGMHWGIHGYDHYWMNRLEQPQLEDDITRALEVFDDVLPSCGWACCYPYGSVDDKVMKTVAEMGAAVGFTTHPDYARIREDNNLALPRLDTNDFPPVSMNYANFQYEK